MSRQDNPSLANQKVFLSVGQVTSAQNGIEALEICDSGNCQFDLLMTDVVMPQMGGRELAEKIGTKLPDLKIHFTSG